MNAIRRAPRASHLNARLPALALILGLTGAGLTATGLATTGLATTGLMATPDRSYRASVEDNEIWNTAGETIDVSEGTRDTPVGGTTSAEAGDNGQDGADSLIATAGDSTVVESDTGSNARLDTDSAVLGYQVRIDSSESGNTVACDSTGATPGLSIVVCTDAEGSTPTPTPAGSSVTVSTSAQLTAALTAAVPGQTIVMTPGTYVGKFVAATPGTSSQPITLTGPATAVLTTGSSSSGYGLHVTGSNWRLTGFSVSIAQKGIVLDRSSNTVIDGVDVGKIGQEAIHVRTNSVDVIIRNTRVHDTGLSTASYGEGIYVGTAKSNWSSIMGSSSTPDRSDRVLIENNTILNTTAEGIDIKEGTTGGIVRGNSFTNSGHSGANYADSWVDVKGNGYLLESNSGSGTLLDAFQVHSVMTGWGGGNLFRSNTVIDAVPGYEVRISSSEPGNIVTCKSSNATLGLTNITCT